MVGSDRAGILPELGSSKGAGVAVKTEGGDMIARDGGVVVIGAGTYGSGRNNVFDLSPGCIRLVMASPLNATKVSEH